MLGEVAQPDKNMKMKDFSIQNSTVSVNRTDLGSSSGKILLGLLDVIRCGIQRYRVCKILKSMESEICDYLKVDMTYDYFPTKFEDKKSEEVVKTEIQAIPNVKIKTEIKSESKSDSEGKNETEDEDKNDNDNDNDKSDDNENEEKVIKLVNGTVGEKVVVKNEICNEEEKKIKEEIDRIELEKIKKIEMEKELQIVREKKSIFLKEFLSSDRAVFLVTLPDSYLLITASPRYGFEIKSVVCNEEPNPFSHFIQIQDANGKKNRIRSESVAQAAAGDRSTETSNNTHTTATRNDSKHTPPCMYHPCESLFHPMSVRVDLTQQLVRSLKSVVLGSYLRCRFAHMLLLCRITVRCTVLCIGVCPGAKWTRVN